MTRSRKNNIAIPTYTYTLKYALDNVLSAEYVEIIVNHKFAIYKGIKKSIYAFRYWPFLKDCLDLIIEYSELYEKGPVNKYKIYINDELLENLIMDEENKWYDEHDIKLYDKDLKEMGLK